MRPSKDAVSRHADVPRRAIRGGSAGVAALVTRQHQCKIGSMRSRSSIKQTFAQRLSTLVSTAHPPGRGRFTQMEIVAGVKELGGDLSQPYLSQLLRGTHEPSDRVVRDLAAFFGVSPEYFIDDDEYRRTNDYIALLRKVSDSEVLAVSARAVDLPSDALDRIRSAVEEERRRAGLD